MAPAQEQFGQVVNPWFVADAAALRSQVKGGAQAKSLFEQAERCLSATFAIPPGQLYDVDRAVILWVAGQFAAQAAADDHGQGTWQNVYHPYAGFAQRVFAYADRYNAVDLSGFVDSKRMLALALSDRPGEAMALGGQLAKTCENMPTYHLHMARLLEVQPNIDREQFRNHANKLTRFGGLRQLLDCHELIFARAGNKWLRDEFPK